MGEEDDKEEEAIEELVYESCARADLCFHEAGQGLFYSGRIESEGAIPFSFVYDCGGTKKCINKCVKNFWDTLPPIEGGTASKKRIDLLVLSHLHEDHINGLPTLLQNTLVDVVVMPYYTMEQRILCAIEAHSLNDEVVAFLNDPPRYLASMGVGRIIEANGHDDKNDEGFLGDRETRPEREGRPPYSPIEFDDLDEQSSGYIGESRTYRQIVGKSFTSRTRDKKWVFNFECLPILKVQLEDLKYDLNGLLGDYKGMQLSDIITSIEFKKLKMIYKKHINHNLNKTSVLMYHAPYNAHTSFSSFLERYFFRGCYPYHIGYSCHNTGTLLTGDMELESGESLDILSNLDNAAVMSVPHHGASSGTGIYAKGPIPDLQVISCGITNSYGHPHPEILYVLKDRQVIRCDEQHQWRYTVCAFYD